MLILTDMVQAQAEERGRRMAAAHMCESVEARRRVEDLLGRDGTMSRYPEVYKKEKNMNWKQLSIFALLTLMVIGGVLPAWGQATVRYPVVVAGTYPAVTVRAGTVYNGGAAVTVAQQSVNVAGNETNCSAPSFATCNFVYVNSSGTAAATTTLGTATASGNVLLAFVTTNGGGTAITAITYPWQSGTAWTLGATASTGANAAAVTALSPASAGGTTVGTASLPFSGEYIGATAAFPALLTGTYGQGTTITLPDPGGATASVAYTNGTTAQSLLTGSVGFADSTTPTKKIAFQASGATGATTLTLADTLAASRTVTFTDPGGAANVAYTNPTTAQVLTTTSIAETTGTTSANGAYTAFMTLPMTLGLASYTSVTDIAGQQWFSEIFVPANFTATGACQLNGSSVATDLVIVALWNSSGTLLANSSLSGQLVANNSIFQCQAFVTPVAITGPGRYFVGIQGNATHATEFTTYVTGSAPTGYGVGITAPGAFGTITNITPTTTFTTGQGPIMMVY